MTTAMTTGVATRPPSEPTEDGIKIPDVLPVLPLKDTVIFHGATGGIEITW